MSLFTILKIVKIFACSTTCRGANRVLANWSVRQERREHGTRSGDLVPPSARNGSVQELEEVGEHAVRPQGDTSRETSRYFHSNPFSISISMKSIQEMAVMFNVIWQESELHSFAYQTRWNESHQWLPSTRNGCAWRHWPRRLEPKRWPMQVRVDVDQSNRLVTWLRTPHRLQRPRLCPSWSPFCSTGWWQRHLGGQPTSWSTSRTTSSTRWRSWGTGGPAIPLWNPMTSASDSEALDYLIHWPNALHSFICDDGLWRRLFALPDVVATRTVRVSWSFLQQFLSARVNELHQLVLHVTIFIC